MKTTIGIFQGKQKTYNTYLLETLYSHGPLTAWEMTKTTKGNRMSLHATYNKRLRILQKKGYVSKAGKFWTLQFKGIIAVLITQPQPEPWNKKWTEIIRQYIERTPFGAESLTVQKNGKDIADIARFVKRAPIILGEFQNWVALANEVKNLMEKGFVNLDVIKNQTLLLLLVSEFSEGSQEKGN